MGSKVRGFLFLNKGWVTLNMFEHDLGHLGLSIELKIVKVVWVYLEILT